MENIPTKVPGSTLTSTEFNSPNDEQKNMVECSGQTLNGGDSTQFSKALTNVVASADYYTDTGTAVAYSLATVELNKAPTKLLDGLRARFIPANTNSGPATAAVAALGPISIKKFGNLVDVEAGDIQAGSNVELAYRKSANVYELITLTNPSLIQSINLFNSFSGMNLSNDGGAPLTTIDLAPGTFKSKTTTNAFTSTTVIAKDLSMPWADGTAQGGRAAGVALTADTWYHVFPIAKLSGEVDMGFDTDVNAANLLADANVIAAGYTLFRRRGSILTDGGSNIIAFTNKGDLFYWTDALNQSMGVPAQIPAFTSITVDNAPIDVSVDVQFAFAMETPATPGDSLFVSSTSQSFTTPFPQIITGVNGGGAHVVYAAPAYAEVTTDTIAQIKIARENVTPSAEYDLYVIRWREIDL